jgi:hypothetical protein
MSQLLERETEKSSGKKLELLIKEAVRKLGVSKENDICPYIPINTGGHIHHFTMKKMKTVTPAELAGMISQYILQVDRPVKVSPKKRAARGLHKQKNRYVFSPQELQRLRNIARLAGDKEMISRLSPKTDHQTIKRMLISSIKRDRVDQELWSNYADSVTMISSESKR